MYMTYNFSPRASDLIATAQLVAQKYKHSNVSSMHLLMSVIEMKDSIFLQFIEEDTYFDSERLITRLHHYLENSPSTDVSDIKLDKIKLSLTEDAERIIKLSNNISKKMNHSFIGTEHIALSIVCYTESSAFKFLYEQQVDLPVLANKLKSHLDPQQSAQEPQEAITQQGDSAPLAQGEALGMFSANLTEAAKNNELDPVLHRDFEIERLMQVLCRRQKNNPVLVGEPGVGKTAIVEGLCNNIASGNVPLQLKDIEIYSLDLSLMVAGTKFRGQFEERMKQVMDDLLSLSNAVVFIDEIHMLVGAGNADGAMDAANILKPALSRGGISCIGTTTFDEYREFIEEDGALERRFQKINVSEPDADITFDILQGIKYKYEEFHNVNYTDSAVKLAVDLSERYLTDRFFPDKAIDILDECASRIKLKKDRVPGQVSKIDEKLAECNDLIKENLEIDDYIAAATYRSAEKKLKARRTRVIDRARTKSKPITITNEHVKDTVSKWCGIPLEQLKKSESKKLASLEKNLNKHVIGQKQAVSTICDCIIRGRMDVGDPDRPIGSFLMLGPTGVGKTYLAKQLAKFVYGDEENMVRVDMSELMESHSVSKLIGSPPGYVGYGEGGQLTETVRQNPYTVVLLDEIEKAHPDIMQLLLQLLDEGCLTDSRGVSVNFKNCIILMTSNIGAERMQRNHVVGFGSSESDNMDSVKKMLMQHLRPEFINRLDEIIFFNSLDEKTCKLILNNELRKFINRMDEQQVKLNITTQVKKMLLEEGFDKKYGARPLRRVIQSHVQTPLAKFLLVNERPVHIQAALTESGVQIEQKEAPVE